MNQPFNEVKASSLAGVSLDCNLSTGAKIGGGTATDNTAALNAFLATASATNPIKLILDGPSLVTGLVIATAGHTVIEGIGWDSGIFIASGSNADSINNGKVLPFDGGAQPSPSGANVAFRNFYINGNRGNGTNGNSTSGNPRGVTGTWWYCNLNIVNINGVRIEDMYLYDAPAYSIRLNGCSDIAISNCTVINPNTTATFNNDCIHIDGPSVDIRIIGNHLDNNNSDDGIALNAPEGYSGAIDRVAIVGNTFHNTISGVRMYGTTDGEVGSVVFADNNGIVGTTMAFLGFSSSTAADENGRSVVFSGNSFQVGSSLVSISSNTGDVTLTDCTLLSPAGAVDFIVTSGGAVSSLTINHCRIYRTDAGNNTSTPLIASNSTATISRMTINGFYVVNQEGQSYSAIADLLVMANLTISALYVAALDYTNITALTSTYTGITNLYGAFQPETQIQSKTGAYTLLPTDRTVLASTTAGSFAVTLPATAYRGQKHTIKNTGTANTLTVTGTVDGSANPTLATLAKITVENDGTSWWSV